MLRPPSRPIAWSHPMIRLARRGNSSLSCEPAGDCRNRYLCRASTGTPSLMAARRAEPIQNAHKQTPAGETPGTRGGRTPPTPFPENALDAIIKARPTLRRPVVSETALWRACRAPSRQSPSASETRDQRCEDQKSHGDVWLRSKGRQQSDRNRGNANVVGRHDPASNLVSRATERRSVTCTPRPIVNIISIKVTEIRRPVRSSMRRLPTSRCDRSRSTAAQFAVGYRCRLGWATSMYGSFASNLVELAFGAVYK